MISIDKILADLVKVEGGSVNNKYDSGGLTNWGWTQKAAEAIGFKGSVTDMTKQQALDLYRQHYFFKPGFGLVFDVLPTVAAELFDTGVNCGPALAGKFFQRCLNVLNNKGTF